MRHNEAVHVINTLHAKDSLAYRTPVFQTNLGNVGTVGGEKMKQLLAFTVLFHTHSAYHFLGSLAFAVLFSLAPLLAFLNICQDSKALYFPLFP